ncbi:MAG: PorP/SprF family type IX secretion system membrane protein [Bacteroidales bacterium]|nr:PorP/SprF family type IX secretion system membrane protein [Bacteroidales bacterium]
MGTRIVYIFFGVAFVLSVENCFAQHNIIYRNHSLHQVLVNPATAGSEFFPVAALSYQKQWLGISQSPGTIMASTSLRMGNFDFYNPKMFISKSNLKTQERIGLGLGIYSDRNGPVTSRGMNLAYAYHIALSNSRLSFGLSGSAKQSALDGSVWDPITPGDPLLGNGNESYFNFNANVGVYYYGANYFAGFAANHLIPLENKLESGENVKQDYILHGGYLFRSMEDIKIEPSIHFRYLDYEEFEFDLQAKIYFQHIHWVTLAYRSYKALAVMGGLKVRQFYLAYYYEANLSPVIKYSAGTHGLHIGLNLGMRRIEGF